MTHRSKPELLAPAGDRDCIRAAIENGADAVYFGLDSGFNARARAKNFAPAELPEIMAELHGRGLAGYVTLNTLIFPSELPEVETHVREVAAAGVDAVLVQDLGLVRLIRAICPDLPIHASTQMTLTSSQSIAAAQELGASRVVLARECSLDEIHRIGRETTMPLEVFVHGALCVAYSGQCLTSESLGGRSANRGQCAQACRLPYDLVCDGRDVDLGEQKYLLSPQDLAAFDLIPQLIEAGVCSFKIEGRLKTPEYVANIVRHYRQAIDAAWAGRPAEFSPRDVEEMELSFSRGFSPGWLQGCDHKMLVPALSSSKRGVLLGHVTAVRRERVVVQLRSPTLRVGQTNANGPLPDQAHTECGPTIKRGDGVSFDCGQPVDDPQGGRVYEVFQNGRLLTEPATSGVVELAFAHGALTWSEIRPGQRVWKTDDPELTSRLRKTFTGTVPQRRTVVHLAIRAAPGQLLEVSATTESGVSCVLSSAQACELARKHPLTEETLSEQLGRLGATPFELRSVTAEIVGRPMLPLSVLGKLRHALVARLTELSQALPTRVIAEERVLPKLRTPEDTPRQAWDVAPSKPRLWVLCRSLAQLREVLAAGMRLVYVDFQDIREYREAVSEGHAAGAETWLATPRIQKPDEMGIFHALAKHGAKGILARNMGGLRFYREHGIRAIADFSLNCANDLTARYLREQGAERVTASYDLNREQLFDLVAASNPAWVEVVVHQHMPMFHMEHCVFCAVLSPGTNKTNCGRPCDTHQVKLRDRIGMEHPLVADVGCRNTLFNAVPQSAAEAVPQLLAAGVRNFRVELLDAAGHALLDVLDLYRRLLAGVVTAKEVWSKLQASNRVGVTRGTLEERRNPLAIL
ncbi:MAG: U32 family peptidase [Planctomycetaceae bacterium]|nr:U32 family peptidase [Planctomycetaceae bacterium]